MLWNSVRHASLWCIFSAFYKSQSNTCLPIQCARTLETQIGFLYPISGAELLSRKHCSAQHCKGYATSLKICLYKANALHTTVKTDSKSEENPAVMKLKGIKNKSFRHSMHCKPSRVSFVSGATNSCRF